MKFVLQPETCNLSVRIMRCLGGARDDFSSHHQTNPIHHIHNERRDHHIHHMNYKHRRGFHAPEFIPECLDNP